MRHQITNRTRTFAGFTLIASLMLLLLMSGVAVGLMMMVDTESRVGNSDLENNSAYHAAEGAMEKMASDLNGMYQSILAPSAADIAALKKLAPNNDPMVTYPDYSLTAHTKADGTLDTGWGKISSGAYQDLYAQILKIDLAATAQRPLGDQVSMVRTVEVAMIPVFQFGVFSDSDLGFFSSPDLTFSGRVHTNGDLYLGVANGNTLTFNDKLTAYGEVIRTQLPNGLSASSNNDSGTVNILTASNGCTSSPKACRAIAQNEGSVVGGPGSAYNSGSGSSDSWDTVSKIDYKYEITNGDYGKGHGTGVKALTLPFVRGTDFPYEIIRRPPQGESAVSQLGGSRLYNQAQIRVLLADDPRDLPPYTLTDANNIRLANISNPNGGPDYSRGVPLSGLANLASGGLPSLFFAEASTGIPNHGAASDWSVIPANASAGYQTLVDPNGNPVTPEYAVNTNPVSAPTVSGSAPYYSLPNNANTARWNLLDGYIRVEIRLTDGTYIPITKEWLELGFARGPAIPTGIGANPVAPKAILLLQKQADRNGDNNVTAAGSSNNPADVLTDTFSSSVLYGDSNDASAVNVPTNHLTRTNWYPINFYDAREGEMRDVVRGDTSCAVNGVMNAVEVDVANLRNWLLTSATGQTVENVSQNGYILYFSDRRGMLPNPNNGNLKQGEYGFEDVINTSSGGGSGATPDGSLEPLPPNKTQSPEDVNFNGRLDNYGAMNLGLGFGVNGLITANPIKPNPYTRIDCPTTARKNWVSGARHVLKLVDADIGKLPTVVSGGQPEHGGFTVASENPVYIQGNYNSADSAKDPTWTSTTAAEPLHAASAVIADSVTLLSNSWTETVSLNHPSDANSGGSRPASPATYYRLAIAAGKNINFPNPGFSGGVLYGYGTDGGLHNFLRFLEDWSGSDLWYKGSLVSLYYSTYGNGTFKCCAYSVYQPPVRHYAFDPLFAIPVNLPPGTPSFRDVENLSYRQTFTARTN